jgi:ribosomal protein L11 methyltransferase
MLVVTLVLTVLRNLVLGSGERRALVAHANGDEAHRLEVGLEALLGRGFWKDIEGKTVIDYGAGSGILAIASALKGALRVIAVDHDPQSLAACADNARRNGVEDRMEIVAPDGIADVAADVLLANILAQPLIELAPRFQTLLAPGGRLVLSGILAEQGESVAAAYRPWLDDIEITALDEWLRLTGVRR